MRLIDADALKEDLTRFYDNEVTARELIDEQPTIGGWISVNDRMPDKDGKYLVTMRSNIASVGTFVKTAWFLVNLWDNSQFKYECVPNTCGFYNGDGEGDWIECNVTHWMPLPKPPKEA